jgi:TonB family protein
LKYFLIAVLMITGGFLSVVQAQIGDSPMHVCKGTETGLCATPPKLIHRVDPQYPKKARKQKIQGAVLLQVTVLTNGTPSDIKVMRSLEQSMDQSAVQAVSKWRFAPATYEGNPVPVTVSVEASFRLY